jgi:hypothetical protein
VARVRQHRGGTFGRRASCPIFRSRAVGTEQMDANSGKPWSEMDIVDLTHPSTTGTRSPKRPASYAGTRMRCVRRRGTDKGPIRTNKIRNNGRGSSDEGILAPVRIVIDSAYAP